MSGNPANTAPPTPSGTRIPKRTPRVMTKMPLYAGTAIVALLLAAGAYVFIYETDPPVTRSAEPDAALTAARPGNNMPRGGVIGPQTPPATNTGFHGGGMSDVVMPEPETFVPSHVRPAPGMSETEIAGRKQAWSQYYQDRTAAASTRRTTLASALSSDATSTPVSRNGGKASAGSTGAGNAGGGGGGTLGAGQPPSSPTGAPGPSGGLQDVYGAVPQDAASSHYLATEVTRPLYALEAKQGTVIQCNVLRGMTNELGGQVTLMVTKKVIDAQTGMHTLIPEGSKLIAIYSNDQHYGDERIPAAVTRVIFPSPGNESMDIGTMPVGDESGFIGLHDQVDRHTGRIVFNAALNGIFGVTTSLAQQAASGAVGGNIAQFGAQVSPRVVEAKPTNTIRPGTACTVELTADIGFDQEWVPSGSYPVLPVASR